MTPHPRSATDWEIARLQEQVAAHGGKVYVEIGSHTGGSLLAYGSAMPVGATLVAVDRPLNDEAAQSLLQTAQRLRDRYAVEVMHADSHLPQTLLDVQRHLAGESIDVLLIDGDHSMGGCCQDLDAYLPLVTPGGMVVMHDCGTRWPAKAAHDKAEIVMEGLHTVWRLYARNRRRQLIQEWAGYGVFWT